MDYRLNLQWLLHTDHDLFLGNGLHFLQVIAKGTFQKCPLTPTAIKLQSHRGGKPTLITLGRKAPPPPGPGPSFLDSEGIKSLQLKHNLNATQTRGLLAD